MDVIKDWPAPPPDEKTYEVIGDSTVGGKAKGELVKLSLTAAQEQALFEGGHIRPYVEKPPAALAVAQKPPALKAAVKKEVRGNG